MIIELILIPLLLITFAGWGAWAKILIGNKTGSFSLTVFLGLAFFSIWSCLLSFFTPLTIYVESILLIFSIIPFFFKKLRAYTIRVPQEILRSVWFWLFSFIFILAGSYFPFRPDHFLYYEPTLNWLNQYGLIIGVANIDWLLGQMSVFHIIQAGLDQTIDPLQRINVFITILFLIYIFERKVYLLLLIFPFYFLFIQAPSPDVAIVFLSLVVVNEMCYNYRNENYKILLLISVFTFTIKPVAFWLPLWVFIAGFSLNKKELMNFRIYLFPAALVLIFLIKNVIASSSLFYPVSLTKLDTYWLTDLRIMEISDQNASLYTFDYYFTRDDISSMTFFQKIYYWLSINKLQSIINCFIAIIIILSGIFSFKKRNFLYLSLWIIIAMKTILILSFSGQYRFMLDGIYPLLFIMFCTIRINKTKILIAGLSLSLLLLGIISYPPLLKRCIPDFKLTVWMKGFTKKALLIPENYVIKEYVKEKFGNLDFHISSYSYWYNFDTPPPAFRYRELKLYYDLGIFPQMKDPANIRKGYYMKTLGFEEKEELGKMMETYFQSSR